MTEDARRERREVDLDIGKLGHGKEEQHNGEVASIGNGQKIAASAGEASEEMTTHVRQRG
jgi:hypothetical protein